MASSSTANPPPAHWLHDPAPTVLARLNQTRPATQVPFTTLETHVLVTHSFSHILRIKPAKPSTWTFPSSASLADENRSFIQIVLDMFQIVIEERTLPDLQFLDFVRRRPVMEMLAPGRVCVRVLVSTEVGVERMEEMMRLRGFEEMVECRWVDVESEQHAKGKNSKALSPGLIERVRASLAGVEGEYTRLHQIGCPALQNLYVNSIRTAIESKQIDLGDEIITHTLIALDPTNPNPDTLYLIPVDEKQAVQVSREELWEMQSVVAVPGGLFQMKMWWIVGVVATDGFSPKDRYVRKEMLGSGCRLRIEWVQRMAAQRFVKVTRAPAMARPEILGGEEGRIENAS